MNSQAETFHGPAASSRAPHRGAPLRPLEIAVLLHVGGLLLIASWAFGGGAGWARNLIAGWGSLGLFLLLAALRDRAVHGENVRQSLRWLIPLLGFNLLVLGSCLNPSFSERVFAGQPLLAHTGAAFPRLPSTALPATTLEHLGLFNAIYLSCFNLILAVHRRRALRWLLLVGVGNAVLLSIFGTFQKLTSDGLFFGRVPSPNARYFATFVYGNHWVAYIVLLLAACLGLIFHQVRHADDRESSRLPLSLGLIGLVLMAITPVLAGSRAGVLLVGLLLAAGVIRVLRHLQRARRAQGRSAVLPIAGLSLGVVLALGGAVYLGRDAIQERWQDSRSQWQEGLLGERLRLYRDTLQLAAAQPVFGWGLGSYGQVLQLTRPRPLEANRQYEHSYVDAHSDWLQSLAETGVAGTVLLVLCGLVPLRGSRALKVAGPLPAYLLGGCGLILLYAAVEFPFGNPAVVVSFWTCFFVAVQYCRLTHRSSRLDSRVHP